VIGADFACVDVFEASKTPLRSGPGTLGVHIIGAVRSLCGLSSPVVTLDSISEGALRWSHTVQFG